MKPISLEIVTPLMMSFDTCSHCEILFNEAGLDQKLHQKMMNEYPSDLKEELVKLSDWVHELIRLYKHRLFIRVIDVQSFLGIYRTLRHRIRKYPTFIIEGKETYMGWDKHRLESLLDKHIQAYLLSKCGRIQPSPS